jgi:AAHS family benzoate transporter-like MFS transporter
MEKVNINETIDNAKFNLFHWKVLIWCLLIIIFDGYDLVIYGVALPLLMQQWSLTAVQAGLLASAALFGMMFGAMIFGTLSDRLGRKKTIMICVSLFSGFTFIGAFANNPVEFAILRFIAGLGIGGVMPNVVALMTEYAPKKIRSTLVAIMFSGYAIGGMTSALLGAWLVKDMGWQIMFLIAGIPLLLLPIIWKFLPESLAFLIKSKNNQQAEQIIAKLDPNTEINSKTQLILMKISIRKPLSEHYSKMVEVLALLCFGSHSSCVYLWCMHWELVTKTHATSGLFTRRKHAVLFALNIGGMIGAIGGGALADRFHLKPVITSMFVIGAAALILLGFNSPQIVLYSLIALAGAATIGSQILLYTFVAQFYPTTVRSTGMGWASGIGRIGAIIGPVLTGALLTFELPHQMNFLAIAIPGVIAAFAIFLVNLKVAVNVPESSKSTLQTQASVNQQ